MMQRVHETSRRLIRVARPVFPEPGAARRQTWPSSILRRLMVLSVLMAVPVSASIPANAPKPAGVTSRPSTDKATPSAAEAVRRGNEFLRRGIPASAIKAYQQAEKLEPDSPEVAFVEGLAHYDLKAYDAARAAFLKAATSARGALADDALYSLGTCDHAQALQSTDNPEAALGLLESAMRRYQSVLADRPDHKAARDANFKAASMWRRIKRQLQQQQKKKDQSNDQKDKKKQQDQKNQDQNKKDQQQKQSEQQKKKEPSSQKQQDEKEKQQPARDDAKPKKDDRQNQQKKQQDKQPSDEKQARQASAARQQEQTSREQAQRKLREMMQAVRRRQKTRRETVRRVRAARVDKDW